MLRVGSGSADVDVIVVIIYSQSHEIFLMEASLAFNCVRARMCHEEKSWRYLSHSWVYEHRLMSRHAVVLLEPFFGSMINIVLPLKILLNIAETWVWHIHAILIKKQIELRMRLVRAAIKSLSGALLFIDKVVEIFLFCLLIKLSGWREGFVCSLIVWVVLRKSIKHSQADERTKLHKSKNQKQTRNIEFD